ncbi:chromosomal replication initiator protein [Pseudobutyrivibrio sp. C4]|uniref:chromosomal replication initiator protein DnaA n=1 Tax=Pseudobutyrivibrio sp. C4 TaxID=1520803 RepID=UPI0008B67999|nr:chromosomal replication initiator protein DnaA [Pseudobutyrivibrio sp. C4]SES90586.1 chromosomal replication initiator protein [Pseudobutyrivibrio sp. C4]
MEELLKEKWNTILDAIRSEFNITQVSFNQWLRPLIVFTIDGDNVLLLYDDNEGADLGIKYISKRFKKALSAFISEAMDKEYEVSIISPDEAKQYTGKRRELVQQKNLASSTMKNISLNPKYTFENFVVGKNNRFAQTAAFAIAEQPGSSYNPLYIYGGPGLGKTHLVQAIGNYINETRNDLNILYVTSESYTNELIDNLRTTQNATAMAKFREKYRSVDVFMIDDIQFIADKHSTQEEFFHTFNELFQSGKQIIITSDKPPKDLQNLNDRFISRFEMGLMADIGFPDYETRKAIITRKLEECDYELAPEIQEYIAANFKSNVRKIEGALNKLIAYSKLQRKPVTIEIAIEELQNLITPDMPREITPQLVLEVVSEHFNVSVDQLTSKNRYQSVVRPRHIAMYLCKTMTSCSLTAIGKLLGGKDHATISNGAKKIEEEMLIDQELKRQVEAIKKKINPN